MARKGVIMELFYLGMMTQALLTAILCHYRRVSGGQQLIAALFFAIFAYVKYRGWL
jgi:hypothetical protein